MKLKYFLRGLGSGIIFAAVIFLTAYYSSNHEMTDKEIIEKAKTLGMVEAEDPIKDLITSEKKMTEKNKKDKTEKEKEASTKTTEKVTTEKITTEKVTEEKTTEEEQISITVNSGDTSYTVCQRLEAAGVINDAAEFDTYLVENGYADRIRIDTYSVKKGMSFHDIAEIITKAS